MQPLAPRAAPKAHLESSPEFAEGDAPGRNRSSAAFWIILRDAAALRVALKDEGGASPRLGRGKAARASAASEMSAPCALGMASAATRHNFKRGTGISFRTGTEKIIRQNRERSP